VAENDFLNTVNNVGWIRLEHLSEFQKLAALEIMVYPIEDCITADDYKCYQASGNIVWVMTAKNRWIANFQVNPNYCETPIGNRGTYVSGLAVFDGFQRRGYGRVAMTRLISEYGASTLIARARVENIGAGKLLSDFGFCCMTCEMLYGSLWEWFVRASPHGGEE
jgi:GNAT superfamily N-acetyltransferase